MRVYYWGEGVKGKPKQTATMSPVSLTRTQIDQMFGAWFGGVVWGVEFS